MPINDPLIKEFQIGVLSPWKKGKHIKSVGLANLFSISILNRSGSIPPEKKVFKKLRIIPFPAFVIPPQI